MGGTRSYDLARSFVENGNSVNVLSSTNDNFHKTKNRWSIIERDGLSVHYIYLPYDNQMSYTKRMLVFVQFLYFASLKLIKLDCDILLATSTPLTIGIPALVKKWKHKTPFVFEARDVWPEAVIAIGAIKNKIMQKLLYRLEKIIYKQASAIVPLSIDMKRSVVSRYPEICKNKPVVVIENISEIDRFSNIRESNILENAIGFKPRFSILYAGTFGRVNGIEYVVDLAERTLVSDSSIVFILIGEGAMKEEIIQYAKEKKVLNKNLFILDSVSKQELPVWYKDIDIGSSFVIPVKELWANAANKFFDTLAASRPILINHEGWQAEVIRADRLGYVLPDVLTDEAVTDFVTYTQNQNLIEQQRIKAFEKAKNCYSLEIASQKYLKVFKDIVKK
ncbi:glycosyltransferase family 4 protein [Aequorivita lipolytica]|nr:glycosyltransferase family 4 protein [Aequorivita lipolytica]